MYISWPRASRNFNKCCDSLKEIFFTIMYWNIHELWCVAREKDEGETVAITSYVIIRIFEQIRWIFHDEDGNSSLIRCLRVVSGVVFTIKCADLWKKCAYRLRLTRIIIFKITLTMSCRWLLKRLISSTVKYRFRREACCSNEVF